MTVPKNVSRHIMPGYISKLDSCNMHNFTGLSGHHKKEIQWEIKIMLFFQSPPLPPLSPLIPLNMLDRSERNVKDEKYGNRRVGIDACFSKMQHFPHWSNFLLKLKCDERHGFSSCGHLFAPPGGLYVSIPTTGPVLRRLKASWSSDSWVPMGWTLDNQLNWKQPKQLDATCGSVPTFQDIYMQQLHNFLYSS